MGGVKGLDMTTHKTDGLIDAALTLHRWASFHRGAYERANAVVDLILVDFPDLVSEMGKESPRVAALVRNAMVFAVREFAGSAGRLMTDDARRLSELAGTKAAAKSKKPHGKRDRS